MILPLERDRIVEKELWSVFKHLWDSTLWEIQVLLWSVSDRRLSGGIATGRGVCRMYIEV